MNETINETEWTDFLKHFSSRNAGRPTRLGIFQCDDGMVNDLWVEDGLPLIALDVYPNDGKMRIDILLENYAHSIDGATKLVDIDGDATDLGLDISDARGNRTIVRFEDWPSEKER